jgi:hypothetical protein
VRGVAALALKCGDAAARGEQSGEMAAGGEAGDTDRCWVDPVVGSISAEPADGGFGILDRGRKFRLAGEPVVDREIGRASCRERVSTPV